MACPRALKHPVSVHQLSSLSSEVLRLRLQALNLSVRGSRQQLITRLKSALKSQASRAGRAMPIRPGRSSRCKERTNAASATAQPTELNSERDSDSDGHFSSIEDGSPSLDDLLSLQDRSVLPSAVGSAPSPADTPFATNGASGFAERSHPAGTRQRASIFFASGPQHRHGFASRSSTAFGPALWRRKSCGVSTLILHCFYQTR